VQMAPMNIIGWKNPQLCCHQPLKACEFHIWNLGILGRLL
jgi:hypothetical protein